MIAGADRTTARQTRPSRRPGPGVHGPEPRRSGHLVCEDLPGHGLVLVPPTSPQYDPLLAGIKQRVTNPVSGAPPLPEPLRVPILAEDRPTSAILINNNGKALAGLQVDWWYETALGRRFRQ